MLINRLKNGVGKEADYYIPKNCKPLLVTQPFIVRDEDVPQKVKNGNFKLVFYPNVFTIKRDKQNGEIVLKDISEQNAPLPTTLAAFRPKVGISEVVFNGYMLCIDKDLEASLSSQDKIEVEKIAKHFEKLRANDMAKTARHELKHAENALAVSEVHQNGAAFDEEFFIRKCFLDEISASSNECMDKQNLSEEEAMAIVKKTFSTWMKKPINKDTYYGEKGDFNHQWSVYEEKTKECPKIMAETMYLQLAKQFFTFNLDGKEVDLSAAIDPHFTFPSSQNFPNIMHQQRDR